MTGNDPIFSELIAIVGGTFASEDLTCISVGLLIRDFRLHPMVGLLGCFIGIVAGDFGLWLLGRIVGRPILGWSWVERRLSPARRQRLERWLDERLGMVVLVARFLPGTRAALFVAAGALGNRPAEFLVWSLVAALLWTPLLVLGTALLGNVLIAPLSTMLGNSVLATISVGGGLVAMLHLVPACAAEERRARWIATISRVWRWEFWPNWLFYLPLLPWLALLAVRYRSCTVWTAANPGIPQGGVVGESKFAILSKLPARWRVPSVLITDAQSARLDQLAAHMQAEDWAFPLILKPDASQRGAGVKRVQSLAQAEAYLADTPGAVIAQPYHPGPYEAGIFYYRLPGAARGNIFSITEKQFPTVTGDGKSTLEKLIWRHPRLRMQAATFLERHAAQRDCVLSLGEVMPLAIAGNHCQGTMFRDGSHLITVELEKRIDSIAKHFDGFYFGRFDVRYTNQGAFRAGEELAIVELNGVTSESTNLYDPRHSLLTAYRILFRQWALLFEIGNANRRRGIQPAGIRELVGLIHDYYRQARPNPLAD